MNRFKKFLMNWLKMELITMGSCVIAIIIAMITSSNFTFMLFPVFFVFTTIVSIIAEIICFILKIKD